uniref:Uncharacterized protein n=1 Tax=Meloidogyne enterolobii TaxID=390850 RepID=A0A6V7WPN5_MELEN|nr:unnamed protein product [Meloidogyne enterolobii]
MKLLRNFWKIWENRYFIFDYSKFKPSIIHKFNIFKIRLNNNFYVNNNYYETSILDEILEKYK